MGHYLAWANSLWFVNMNFRSVLKVCRNRIQTCQLAPLASCAGDELAKHLPSLPGKWAPSGEDRLHSGNLDCPKSMSMCHSCVV